MGARHICHMLSQAKLNCTCKAFTPTKQNVCNSNHFQIEKQDNKTNSHKIWNNKTQLNFNLNENYTWLRKRLLEQSIFFCKRNTRNSENYWWRAANSQSFCAHCIFFLIIKTMNQARVNNLLGNGERQLYVLLFAYVIYLHNEYARFSKTTQNNTYIF